MIGSLTLYRLIWDYVKKNFKANRDLQLIRNETHTHARALHRHFLVNPQLFALNLQRKALCKQFCKWVQTHNTQQVAQQCITSGENNQLTLLCS